MVLHYVILECALYVHNVHIMAEVCHGDGMGKAGSPI